MGIRSRGRFSRSPTLTNHNMGIIGVYPARRFGRFTNAAAVGVLFLFLWVFREQLRLDRVGMDSSIVPWIPRMSHQDIFDFEPVNSDVIRAVCDKTEWDAGKAMQVVFTCDNNVGGIGNIRNSILNCVRYTMLAGGSLVMPRIFKRNDSDISHIRTGRRQEMEYLFDRQHFIDSLHLSCPQLRLYNDTDEVYESLGPARTWSLGLFPESLVDEDNIPSTGIEHPESSARTCGTATILSIDRHFFGAHLRTEKDALDSWNPTDPMWEWSEFSKQTDAFFDQAGRWDLSVMYVASDNETQVDMLEADAEPRGVRVVTKQSLLTGKNRKMLDALTWDQKGMIDFLVMLGAAQFGGVGHSSFAWNVALKRHIFSEEKEGFLKGPQMLSDELSQIYGTPGKYHEYASCLWP
uniref:Alternative oxidase n=1 Tax=Colletotrichum fructicola (strain Nara gc5) TaxID=1213859 RepID=L2FDL7_COLFN